MKGSTVALGVAVLGLAAVGAAFWLLSGGPPSAPTETLPGEGPERPAAVPGPAEAAAAPEAGEAPAPSRGVALFGRLVRGTPRVPVKGAVKVTVPGGTARTAASAADGRFFVGGLPPGARVDFVATAEGLLPARHPEVRLDRNGSLDLGDVVLGPGQAIEVVAVDRSARPVPGARIRVSRSAVWRMGMDWVGWSLGDRPKPAAEIEAATGADGKASLRPVPPGSWLVVAEAKGFGPENAIVAIEEGRDPGVVRLVLLPSHSLRGTVTEADGKPAAGVVVIAASSNGNWFSDAGRSEATTDAAGAYAMEALREGVNQISVRPAPDVQSGVGSVQVPQVAVFDIRLLEGITVKGKVLDDAAGTPLEGAQVTVNLWGGMNGDESSLGRAVTGSDGAYEIRRLQPGNFGGITARLEGFLAYPDSKARAPTMQQAVEPGSVREADARLRRGSAVAGRVADAKGAAVRGARVTALTWSPNRGVDVSPPALTDEDGAWRIEGLDTGLTLLHAEADGCSQAEYPVDYWSGFQKGTLPESCSVTVTAEGEARKDLVMVRGGVVTGSVADRDGKPLQGLTVTVSASKNSAGGGAGTSDAQGAFRLEGVAPGDGLVVSAWGPKAAHGTSEPFSLGEAATAEGIRVPVTPGASIAGRVSGSAGAAPGGCTLRVVQGAFNPQQAWNWQWQVRSAPIHPVAADGAFLVEGLMAGDYTLLADSPGAASFRGPKVALAAGEAKEGVEVAMTEEKPISGRVATEAGDPVAGARVSADDAALRQATYGQGPGPVVAVTGPAGEFTVGGIGEGPWLLSADATGFSLETATVKGGTRDVVITLKTGGVISGVVVDGNGAPVADIAVAANPMQHVPGGPQGRTTKTDRAGAFSIRDLKPGEWNVTAGATWGSEGEHVPKTVAGVKTGTADLRIAVEPGLAISGTVVDEEGKPVPGRLGVQVQGTDAEGKPDWSRNRWSQTEGDGTFRVPGLAPGAYTVQVSSQWGGGGGGTYAPASVKGVSAGTGGVVVPLRKGSVVTGRVVDVDGKPWSKGGWLMVTPTGEGGTSMNLSAQVMPDGTFTTPALDPAKTWDLQMQNTPGTAGAVARAVVPGAKELVLQVEKGGTITGRVEDEEGRPVEKVMVQAFVEGTPGGAGGTQGWGQTDAAGAFAVSGLGDYKFRVVAGGWGSDWAPGAPATGLAPGATDVVLRVRKGVVLSGRLVDAAGASFKGQHVLAVPEGAPDQQGSWTQVKEDGTFTIKGLAPGKVRIRAFSPNGQKECGTHEAPASGVVITVPD